MGKVLATDYPANKMMRLVVPLLVLLVSTGAVRAQEWGQVTGPAPGPTQVIGFYTAGCIQGAQALPLEGPGYEAIRVSRNRYWGHPATISYIRTLAERVRAAGQSHLYIGDIGQPRGGPMSFGHASHQVASTSTSGSSANPVPRAQRRTARTRGCARWCAATTAASRTRCSPTSTWRSCALPRRCRASTACS
jgi:hypothetical protein